MEVTRIRALRGPNLWSRHTSLEALVRCSSEECHIARMSGLEARLRARFPEIGALQSIGAESEISIAHALAFAVLGLQAQAGCPVTFMHIAQTLESGLYQVCR